MNIKDNRICFFNTELIDKEKTTAKQVWHKPQPQEVALKLDKPWEGELGFECFFHDGEKYRLYYSTGQRLNKEMDKFDMESGWFGCYAESLDGIHFTKPNLNMIEFKGSKDNNIYQLTATETYIFKDTNPNCSYSDRYKLIHPSKRHLTGKTSSDGIHFTEQVNISEKGCFDTLNTMFYDENLKKYVAFIRDKHRREDGGDFEDKDWAENQIKPCVRDIRVMHSDDFYCWTESNRIKFNDDYDFELYTNCVTKYYRAPQYYIGFPTRYIEDIGGAEFYADSKWSKCFDNVTGLENRKKRFKLHPRYGLVVTDCVFMSSTDTFNWERSNEAIITPGVERGTNWVYGDCFPTQGAVYETTNPVYGYKELSILVPEGTWSRNGKLVRYTLRLDGFASYNTDNEVRKVVTKPFIFEGNNLEINMSASAYGDVYVTIEDSDGCKITSVRTIGDSTEKKVLFEDDLSKFSGKEVTMTFTFKDCDIYSFKFNK